MDNLIIELREEKQEKAKNYSLANELVTINRQELKSSILFPFMEGITLTKGPIDYYCFCKQHQENLLSVIMYYLSSAFSITSKIIEEDTKSVKGLAGNMDFLRYCNTLLKEFEFLLSNEEFLNQILYILYYNRTDEEYDISMSITPEFSKYNNHIEKRVRTFAKEHGIQTD